MQTRNPRPPRFRLLLPAASALSLLPGCASRSGPVAAHVPPAAPPPPAASLPSAAPVGSPGEIPGVANFAQVAPGLYRGAQPTAEGFAELKKRGIKTVVNLRWAHSDRSMLRGTGLRYAHIRALPWAPGDGNAAAYLKVLHDPDNAPVFVHCQHGADRTGYLVAVYRVLEQGWPMADAVREMRAFGYHPIWFQVALYLRHFRAEGLRALLKKAESPKVEVIW